MSTVSALPLMTGLTCQVVRGSGAKSVGLSVGVDGVGENAMMFISINDGSDCLVAVIDGSRFAAFVQMLSKAGDDATKASMEKAQ